MSTKERQTWQCNMLGLLCVVFVSALLTPIVAEPNYALYLRRATARSLTIHIPCIKNNTCRISKLEYESVDGSSNLSSIPGTNVTKSVQESQDASFDIHSLKSSTKYVVRALWKQQKETIKPNISQLPAHTCQANLPPVSGVRVVRAGPGWIDLRWTTLRDENCYSNIIYYVRYKAASDKQEAEWAHFGIYFVDGVEVFQPTHPCEGWPGEFCVILTDRVRSGESHAIEVVGVRYDASEFKKNETRYFPPKQVVQTHALSDSTLEGTYTWGKRDGLTPCSPPPKPPPPSSFDAPMEEMGIPSGRWLVTPMWALVLSVLVILMFIIGASVALWRWQRNRSKVSNGLLNPSNLQTPPPDVCQSSNAPPTKFEQSRPLPTPLRSSNIYDDCFDGTRPGTVYERLREPVTTFKPQTSPRNPIAENPPIPRTRKLINSSGTDQSGLQNTPTLDENQYVPMKSPTPLYDDAQDVLTRNGDGSSAYVAPRQLPTYIEVMDQDAVTPGYNRPYSTMTSKWKAWT